MGPRVVSPQLVGRDAEIARLMAGLERARRVMSCIVLVAGEAGIGKTRLVSEFAERAREQGAHLLLGGCVNMGDGGLPYAPITEALRRLLPGLEPLAREALLSGIDTWLAPLLPEPHGRPDESTVELGGFGRLRLLDAFTELLRRLGRDAPTLLVIEDLHWADRATLDLAAFLARNADDLRLLTVATYRPEDLDPSDAPFRAIAELYRPSSVDRLELRRFGRAEVGDQVSAILDAPADQALVDYLYRRSDGNPFFVEELLAASIQGEGGATPPMLRDILLARLARLSESAQRLLAIVAVNGPSCDSQILTELSAYGQRAVTASLREAIAQHVLIAVADPPRDHYGFRHALLEEVVYADMLAHERARLHAASAELLARRPELSDRSTAHVKAQVAHHWDRAHRPDRTLEASISAGLAAERVFAFADAEMQFARALTLWDTVRPDPPPMGLDRLELLYRVGLAASIQGARDRAVAYARDAVRRVDPASEPVRVAQLYERLGQACWLVGDWAGAREAFAAGLRAAPKDQASAPLARLLVEEAWRMVIEPAGAAGDPVAVARRALEVARAAGAPPEVGFATGGLGWTLLTSGDESGIGLLAEARRTAIELRIPYDIMVSLMNESTGLILIGRIDEGRAMALDGLELTRRLELTGFREGLLSNVIEAEYLTGRWEEARGRIRDELDAPGDAGAANMLLRGTVALVLSSSGEIEAARRWLAEIPDPDPSDDPQIAVWVSYAQTELAFASRAPGLALGRALGGLAAYPPGGHWYLHAATAAMAVRAAADVAERARDRRDHRAAEAAQSAGLEAAERFERLDALVPPLASRNPSDRFRALLAAERTRLAGSSDPEAWAAAARGFLGVTLAYPAAYSYYRQGEALTRAGDRPGAAAALKRARAITLDLGAGPLRAEIEALVRRARIPLEGEPGDERRRRQKRPPGDPFHLTARERDVLALLTTGLTNRQIAKELFISPKTAGVHVSNILAKLGVTGRVEAATIAYRLGIAPPARPAD